MELPSVDQAVLYLAQRFIPANVGNPGRVMPHLTEPVVAVNQQESTMDSLTLVAYVCGPKSLGQAACGRLASQVAIHWTKMGATCRWGTYSFDGKAAMHIVKVYGTWVRSEEPTE